MTSRLTLGAVAEVLGVKLLSSTASSFLLWPLTSFLSCCTSYLTSSISLNIFLWNFVQHFTSVQRLVKIYFYCLNKSLCFGNYLLVDRNSYTICISVCFNYLMLSLIHSPPPSRNIKQTFIMSRGNLLVPHYSGVKNHKDVSRFQIIGDIDNWMFT